MPKYLSERQQTIAAWLDANGISPNNVPVDADMTIEDSSDGRTIRCEVFARDSAGRIQVDDSGRHTARRFVVVPLTVDPPDWWEPRVKPTRDDLLDVLGKVQQLTERWKHTADRKNGPRQELLAVLGEHARPEAP